MIQVTEHESFAGVYRVRTETSEDLATKNLAPGIQVYGEKLHSHGGAEYRAWLPFRSKLAAATYKGLREIRFSTGSKMLYLGVASGTTASHVSDIIDEPGVLYGVEFAPRAMVQFARNVVNHRKNVVPILADARDPSNYAHLVGKVDVIYCDVAQPDQAVLLLRNAECMLRGAGAALIAIKARSIDSVSKPSEIFEKESHVLEEGGFLIKERVNLEPYDRDHVMLSLLYR